MSDLCSGPIALTSAFSVLGVLLTPGWFGGGDGSQFLGFSGLFLQMTDPWAPQAVWTDRTLLMQCTGA